MTSIQKRMHNALAGAIVLKVIILLFLLSMVGCSAEASASRTPQESFNVGGIQVYEFTTPGGATCVMVWSYDGGLDCNFPEYRSPLR